MANWTAAEWQQLVMAVTSLLAAVAAIIAAIKGGQAKQNAACAVEKIDEHIIQSAEQASETQAILRGETV